MTTKTIDTRISDFPIMPLSEVYAMLPNLHARDGVRGFVPGMRDSSRWCKFIMTYNTVMDMADAVALVHAPLNCPSCFKQYKADLYCNFGDPHLHTPTTNIGHEQIVFGGEGKLYQAILAVDRDYRPELIIVLTGCAPGLTLDDVYGVVERAQSEVKARLFHIPTSGFDYAGDGFYDDVLPEFANLMDHPGEIHKDWVNILGNDKQPYLRPQASDPACGRRRNFIGDAEEMGNLIEGMGVKVHVVFSSDPYRRFRRAPEAAINSITCASFGIPLAKAMQEKFGTPYLNLTQPLGPVSTGRWIRMLGEATDHEAEAEELINREWGDIREVWQECERVVAGKTALIYGNVNRPFSIGRMCQELGMEVVMIGNPMQLKTKGGDAVEHWLEVGFNPRYVIRKEGGNADYKPTEIMQWLGLNEDQVVYFYCEFPFYARAGVFDAANVPRVDTTVYLRRHRGYPGRGGGLGYQGAKGLCLMIMEAVKAAQRKRGWTFAGRLQGKPLDCF